MSYNVSTYTLFCYSLFAFLPLFSRFAIAETDCIGQFYLLFPNPSAFCFEIKPRLTSTSTADWRAVCIIQRIICKVRCFDLVYRCDRDSCSPNLLPLFVLRISVTATSAVSVKATYSLFISLTHSKSIPISFHRRRPAVRKGFRHLSARQHQRQRRNTQIGPCLRI